MRHLRGPGEERVGARDVVAIGRPALADVALEQRDARKPQQQDRHEQRREHRPPAARAGRDQRRSPTRRRTRRSSSDGGCSATDRVSSTRPALPGSRLEARELRSRRSSRRRCRRPRGRARPSSDARRAWRWRWPTASGAAISQASTRLQPEHEVEALPGEAGFVARADRAVAAILRRVPVAAREVAGEPQAPRAAPAPGQTSRAGSWPARAPRNDRGQQEEERPEDVHQARRCGARSPRPTRPRRAQRSQAGRRTSGERVHDARTRRGARRERKEHGRQDDPARADDDAAPRGVANSHGAQPRARRSRRAGRRPRPGGQRRSGGGASAAARR